jgi:hypothetical protein
MLPKLTQYKIDPCLGKMIAHLEFILKRHQNLVRIRTSLNDDLPNGENSPHLVTLVYIEATNNLPTWQAFCPRFFSVNLLLPCMYIRVNISSFSSQNFIPR